MLVLSVDIAAFIAFFVCADESRARIDAFAVGVLNYIVAAGSCDPLTAAVAVVVCSVARAVVALLVAFVDSSVAAPAG